VRRSNPQLEFGDRFAKIVRNAKANLFPAFCKVTVEQEQSGWLIAGLLEAFDHQRRVLFFLDLLVNEPLE
jgi:hypothetical protein